VPWQMPLERLMSLKPRTGAAAMRQVERIEGHSVTFQANAEGAHATLLPRLAEQTSAVCEGLPGMNAALQQQDTARMTELSSQSSCEGADLDGVLRSNVGRNLVGLAMRPPSCCEGRDGSPPGRY
jgi:hypothetical protein